MCACARVCARLWLCDQLQDEERRRKQQLEEIRKREAEERAKQEEERRWRDESGEKVCLFICETKGFNEWMFCHDTI